MHIIIFSAACYTATAEVCVVAQLATIKQHLLLLLIAFYHYT